MPAWKLSVETSSICFRLRCWNVHVEETVNEEQNAFIQHPTTEEVGDIEKTQNEAAEEAIPSTTEIKNTVAEQADPEHPCDLCDKRFGTLKGLRAHVGRQHKTIPQIDGVDDIYN